MNFIRKHLPKIGILYSIAILVTIGVHHFIPGHHVPFLHSYFFHFILDTFLVFLIITVGWEGNSRINIRLDKKYRWEIVPVKRLVLQVLTNTIYSFIAIIIIAAAYGEILNHFISEYSDQARAQESYPVFENAFHILLVIFLLYQAVYLGVYFFHQWSKSLVEAERLKRESIHSQLHALQNQINPHFLFNNLNSLVTLISEDKNSAIEFVEELANVYRYLLQQQDEHLVRVTDELKFINSYIYLQQTRSGSNLKTEIKVDKKYHDYYIAPQTLQILVENAIKHNIISSDKPLMIRIYNTVENIVVENNLQKKLSTQAHTGIGLQNIKDRYRILGYRNIEVDETNNHFKVTVPIINPGNVNASFNH
jgi:two-component system, LytTR family, sensor kinase